MPRLAHPSLAPYGAYPARDGKEVVSNPTCYARVWVRVRVRVRVRSGGSGIRVEGGQRVRVEEGQRVRERVRE